jgi:hypothetical protein
MNGQAVARYLDHIVALQPIHQFPASYAGHAASPVMRMHHIITYGESHVHSSFARLRTSTTSFPADDADLTISVPTCVLFCSGNCADQRYRDPRCWRLNSRRRSLRFALRSAMRRFSLFDM